MVQFVCLPLFVPYRGNPRNHVPDGSSSVIIKALRALVPFELSFDLSSCNARARAFDPRVPQAL